MIKDSSIRNCSMCGYRMLSQDRKCFDCGARNEDWEVYMGISPPKGNGCLGVLLLLFIPLVFFFGCENEEEDTNSQLDGIWLYSELIVNGEQENSDWCIEQSHLEFLDNWEANYNEYYTDFPENPAIEPCELSIVCNIIYEATSESSYLMTWTFEGYENEMSGNATVIGDTLVFSGTTFEGAPIEWTFIKNE